MSCPHPLRFVAVLVLKVPGEHSRHVLPPATRVPWGASSDKTDRAI